MGWGVGGRGRGLVGEEEIRGWGFLRGRAGCGFATYLIFSVLLSILR